jgi:hypothetical protein
MILAVVKDMRVSPQRDPENPIVPRTRPSDNPERSSLRTTLNQSRNRNSPRAIARMTRVVAWDPELPPLEMIKGKNIARIAAFSISPL